MMRHEGLIKPFLAGVGRQRAGGLAHRNSSLEQSSVRKGGFPDAFLQLCCILADGSLVLYRHGVSGTRRLIDTGTSQL